MEVFYALMVIVIGCLPAMGFSVTNRVTQARAFFFIKVG